MKAENEAKEKADREAKEEAAKKSKAEEQKRIEVEEQIKKKAEIAERKRKEIEAAESKKKQDTEKKILENEAKAKEAKQKAEVKQKAIFEENAKRMLQKNQEDKAIKSKEDKSAVEKEEVEEKPEPDQEEEKEKEEDVAQEQSTNEKPDQELCKNDPNFAVVCSFLDQFGGALGVPCPSILDLETMLEKTGEPDMELVTFMVKMLRKLKKTVSFDKWERVLIKFTFSYSSEDGWELDRLEGKANSHISLRFGYKRAKLALRIRLLKHLCEAQFDLNAR